MFLLVHVIYLKLPLKVVLLSLPVKVYKIWLCKYELTVWLKIKWKFLKYFFVKVPFFQEEQVWDKLLPTLKEWQKDED